MPTVICKCPASKVTSTFTAQHNDAAQQSSFMKTLQCNAGGNPDSVSWEHQLFFVTSTVKGSAPQCMHGHEVLQLLVKAQSLNDDAESAHCDVPGWTWAFTTRSGSNSGVTTNAPSTSTGTAVSSGQHGGKAVPDGMYMCEPIKNILQRLPNEIRLFKEIANLLDDTMSPCGVWLNESARSGIDNSLWSDCKYV